MPFTFPVLPVLTAEEEQIQMQATTTLNQFDALAKYLSRGFTAEEIRSSELFTNFSRNTTNIEDVKKRLRNAWNTERILHTELEVLEEQDANFMAQWLFPQAYYWSFSVFLAFLKANNNSENSHAAVLKKYDEFVFRDKVPKYLRFYSTGIKKEETLYGLDHFNNVVSTLTGNSSIATIHSNIGHFLNSTRRKELDKKREDNNYRKQFKTKAGSIRENLRKEDWQKVSTDIGVTSLLDLLYRKRIKANYDDIDTFECPGLRTEEICDSLITICDTFSKTFEILIAIRIGKQEFIDFVESVLRNHPDDSSLSERLAFHRDFFNIH